MVIDNASSGGTQQWLGTKTVATVLHTQQISLSACWNQGLKAFWSIGSREVLVINNDVVLRPDTYRLLVSCQEPFITGVSVDKESQLGNVGDRSPQELMTGAREHPDFSCFMINKWVTDRGLWFDTDYFPAFYEDNAFHVEMHRKGIKALCVNVPFLHLGSQTIKTASMGEREAIMRGAELNKAKFRRKYGCVPGTREYAALFV
jgi:GT2 family glycosyltransferase